MKHYDIIVVGGGILGISHAYHCLRAGLRVALIERHPWPQHASVRNFGQVVPSGFGSRWQQYGRESVRIYKEIASEMDITLRAEGSIYIASDEEELQLIHELAEINRANDYESHLFSRDECLIGYPGLQQEYVRGGLYFPEEVVIDPRVGVSRIIIYCQERLGLDYIPNTLVNNVFKMNDKVAVTTSLDQQFTCDKAFVCSGTDFQTLFPDVHAESDTEVVKIHMMETMPQSKIKIPGAILTGLTIRRYESFHECPSYAAIKANENPQSYQNRHGVHILFKQSLDGSVIIGDSHHYQRVSDGLRADFDTDNELNCYMLTQAQRIYDLDTWQIRHTWLGYYCQSASREIFHHTVDDDIHIVTAIGGKGMTGSLGYAQQHVADTLSLNNIIS